MTTIAAFVTDDEAAMAADRCLCFGNLKMELTSPKIFRVADYLVGAAGSARVLDVVSSVAESANEFWSAHGIADRVMTELSEKSLLEDGKMSADMLIVKPGELWLIGNDGGAHQVHNYAAIGSGCEYAVGAMCVRWWALDERGAEGVVLDGVSAATSHDPYTSGEIDVLVLK